MRIIAVEQYGAGPWATLQLADLGAEVIKIEDPASGGDVGRYIPPYQHGEDSLFFETFNRNKLSMSLDMREPAGRGVFEDLVRHSNVVFSNLRGDQPEKLRIRYSDLAHLNRDIVCCSLSGFGTTGPRVREPGYDYLIQGLAGWMSITGQENAPPTKSGASLVDYSAGYAAALAIVAAVYGVRETGHGCDCDISLFETALHQLTYLGTWAATSGHVAERLDDSAHPSIVPFQNFETSDGWIVVACPKEKFWANLCSALGDPQLASDPRFRDMASRLANRAQLVTLLRDRFKAATVDAWLETLTSADVPCAPVNDIKAALSDAQASHRDVLASISHPVFGDVRQVATPFRLGGYAPAYLRAPRRSEHQQTVLEDVCGYDAQTIDDLTKAGAFGKTLPDGHSEPTPNTEYSTAEA